MSQNLETFTDANWSQEVLASATPVLVDFWADWCQPCKALVPALQAAAERYSGKLRVGKVNVEDNSQVAEKYNINRLPTLLIIKGGQVSEQRTGLVSKDELIKLLATHVG